MRRTAIAVFAAAVFFSVGPVRAQTATTTPPPAENLAAAREVIDVIKPAEQFKTILPTLFQNFRAAIVQSRPEVEKQYDAMIPLFNQSAQKRLGELTDTIVAIYARNFTVAELHDITAFYRSPTGQKFIERQATLSQQSLAAGQQFGQAVASDVQQQMSGAK
jgi:uncharacterized protein